jgi:hypothetical protein
MICLRVLLLYQLIELMVGFLTLLLWILDEDDELKLEGAQTYGVFVAEMQADWAIVVLEAVLVEGEGARREEQLAELA